MKYKGIYLTLCGLFIFFSSLAQFDQLKKDIALSDSLNTDFSREKLFIHTDRSWYTINDTLWLKGYILSARDLSGSDSSRIAYIEIIDSEGRSVKKTSTHALSGIFYGCIALSQTDFKQGAYMMRAWTNYMRNYGDSLFFQSNFTIINPGSEEWNPSTAIQPAVRRETPRKSQPAPDPKKIDLQFLPEGGNFITGKMQRLGFKAINVWGKGVDVSGRIENSKKQVITTFTAEHNGMGTVSLQPEPNEKYTAIIDDRTYDLPRANVSGTILQVDNAYHPDSVLVTVDASADLYDKTYFIRASAKGITCAFGTMRLKDSAWHKSFPKEAFPSGICRFTLYDSRNLPVNERVIFIWHNDTLQLDLSVNKPVFHNRDSVELVLNSKSNNEPVRGSFSVSVIDTGVVPFEKNAENIISYMLLSSDLKGNIEQPAFYIGAPYSKATDALMLTQGWVQYNRFFTKRAFGYEYDFAISGKVTNILNRPVANSQLTLFGKDGKFNSFISSGKTDKKGKFVFSDFPPFTTDTVSLLIRALNKGGKSFGIGVDVDVPAFPAYRFKPLAVAQPPMVQDTAAIAYAKQEIAAKGFGKGYLQEVIVTAKARVKNSKNLNEDGGSDLVINDKVLSEMPKESLLDVLRKKLKGFNRGNFPRSLYHVYKINGDVAVFVIDGYNISQYYQPSFHTYTSYVEYLDTYLNYINAEDIAGIEVMLSSKNTLAYEQEWNTPHIDATGGKSTFQSGITVRYAFIEITTYSQNGAFYKKVPGVYLYKPLAPVVARSFYAPKYKSTDTSAASDFRATVYWKPDIITDEKGEARFSFYTSDSNSGYLIIAQGTDLQGKLGFAFLPLYIRKDNKTANK